MTDAEIITLVLQGKTDHFATLVERYFKMVRGVCASHVFTAAVQEDLLQESFVHAFTKLDRLRNPKRFGSWLAKITRNKCTDWLRSERRRREGQDRFASDTRRPQSQDARDQALRRDLCEWVRTQIAELPDKTREAMVLCYVEGCSSAEAATFLGIRESSVRKRLQYGREMVRETLFSELKNQPSFAQDDTERRKRVMAALPVASVPWLKTGAATATTGGLLAFWHVAIVASLVTIALIAAVWRPWATSAVGETPTDIAAVEEPVSEEITAAAMPEDTEAVTAVESTPAEQPEVPKGTIHGRVIDAQTGEGVSIQLRLIGLDSDWGRSGTELYSNPDGAFSFSSLNDDQSGPFRIELSPIIDNSLSRYVLPEPVTGERILGETTPEVILALQPRPTISGCVRTAKGEPVPKAHIMRTRPEGNVASGIATTDENGYFSAPHDGGVWALHVMVGGLDCEAVRLELDPAASATQDFTIPPYGSIIMNVTAPDGSIPEEIDRIHVSADRENGGRLQGGLPAYRQGEGYFVIPYVCPGVLDLRIEVKGYAEARLPVFRIAANEEKVFNIRLQPAREHLDVQVVDEHRQPIPDYRANLYLTTTDYDTEGNMIGSGSSNYQQGKTNAHGQVRFDGLWPETFTLEMGNDRTYEYFETDVEIPHRGVLEVVLVKKPTQAPDLQTFSYEITVIDSARDNFPLSSDEYTDCIVVNQLGKVSRGTNLSLGDNWVVLVKSGYTAGIQQVTASDNVPDKERKLVVTLGEGGSIYGVAESYDPSTCSARYLYVYPADLWFLVQAAQQSGAEWERLGRILAQGATVQEDGSFELRHLPDGTYVVALSTVGSLPHVVSPPVQVAAGHVSGPVYLTPAEQP